MLSSTFRTPSIITCQHAPTIRSYLDYPHAHIVPRYALLVPAQKLQQASANAVTSVVLYQEQTNSQPPIKLPCHRMLAQAQLQPHRKCSVSNDGIREIQSNGHSS
mmetsp:Transcript_61186/g.167886  ORF Transcript_61186/g.167886 Transcript_61186/m.167886 type:complete len:105 (-) Transcript_61186:458-772(-)